MYFIILYLSIALIIGLNLIFNFAWQTLLNLLISFVIVLVPSLFCALLIRILPKSWFNSDNKVFKVGKKERNFYEKLGIKKWKDKIPELGQTANFKKNKIQYPNNPEYLKKFIQETVYGESLHFFCILTAFLSLLLVPNHLILPMTLPIAIVYSVYNLPSLVIQRYNRPRLEILLKRVSSKTPQQDVQIETEQLANNV